MTSSLGPFLGVRQSILDWWHYFYLQLHFTWWWRYGRLELKTRNFPLLAAEVGLSVEGWSGVVCRITISLWPRLRRHIWLGDIKFIFWPHYYHLLTEIFGISVIPDRTRIRQGRKWRSSWKTWANSRVTCPFLYPKQMKPVSHSFLYLVQQAGVWLFLYITSFF